MEILKEYLANSLSVKIGTILTAEVTDNEALSSPQVAYLTVVLADLNVHDANRVGARHISACRENGKMLHTQNIIVYNMYMYI